MLHKPEEARKGFEAAKPEKAIENTEDAREVLKLTKDIVDLLKERGCDVGHPRFRAVCELLLKISEI